MLDPVRLVEALAEDRAGLPQDRLREDLGSAVALIAWIAGREVLTIQELDRCAPDPSDPAKDTAGKVERDQKLEPGKAKAKTRKAEQMKSLPETQKALENGEVSEAHAQALADARAKADAKARAALEQNEKRLLSLARYETATEFHRRLDRFVKVHSEDDGRDEHDRKNARQRLSIYKDKDGMTQLRGAFGPEAGQRITSALDEVSEELFRRDHRDHPESEPVPATERTSEQRLAEALDLLCRRHRGQGPAKNYDRAVVILSYDDLLGKLDAAGIASTLADGTPITTAPDGTTWRRRPDRCQPEGRPAEPPPAAASGPGSSGDPAATLFTHAA